MRDLDRPVGEAAVQECGMDSPMMGGMTPPMSTTPPHNPPTLSVNLNAQGMDDIESIMRLMTKVNPDMINQPKAIDIEPMGMPSLTPPGPSISSIGDLGDLDKGPLKMLPNLDKDDDNTLPPGDLDRDDGDDITKAMGDIDGDGDHDMDDHDMEKDSGKKDDKEEKEAFGNSVEGDDGPDYKGMSAAIPDGDDMNRPKKSFSGKPYRGDNPMAAGAYESTDLRASIRAELQQRLAEAKGAK